MATLYDLKPRFQALLKPVSQSLWRAGVTANQVTLAALVLSFAGGGCVALFPTERWPLILMGPVLLVRMALNAIDGMIARAHNQESPIGALLNETGDVASDAALYLPLAFVPAFDPRLVVVAVLLAVLTEMTGVVAVQIGASRNYRGPLGKSDRAFVFGALSLLVGLGVPAGRWLNWGLALTIVLLAITVFNRGRGALEELRK